MADKERTVVQWVDRHVTVTERAALDACVDRFATVSRR